MGRVSKKRTLVFVDLEVVVESKRVYKLGAVKIKASYDEDGFLRMNKREIQPVGEMLKGVKDPNESRANQIEKDLPNDKFFSIQIDINHAWDKYPLEEYNKEWFPSLEKFYEWSGACSEDRPIMFLCNHNLIEFDSKFLLSDSFRSYCEAEECLIDSNTATTAHKILEYFETVKCVDTLQISPLLLPEYPIHKLGKDYKDVPVGQKKVNFNIPTDDAVKCQNLLYDELKRYKQYKNENKEFLNVIAYLMKLAQKYNEKLWGKENELIKKDNILINEFFDLAGYDEKGYTEERIVEIICRNFKGLICDSGDNRILIKEYVHSKPMELAYLLSNIYVDGKRRENQVSGKKVKEKYKIIIPPYILNKYPYVEEMDRNLRQRKCSDPNCRYCNGKVFQYKKDEAISYKRFDSASALKAFFGKEYKFKKFKNIDLQKEAVDAALSGESMLSIFPTGGGKSIAFQLPAMMQWEMNGALTLVISPLQSLMNDQVENLEQKDLLEEAKTINGSTPGEFRGKWIDNVRNGNASLLYVSPESLRSSWLKNLVHSRYIARVVIDEAHCFSGWGQDFRPDYRYIGRFIRELQEDKCVKIPVSCYTATADERVRQDIIEYFKSELEIDLSDPRYQHITSDQRNNLHYFMSRAEYDEEACNSSKEKREARFKAKFEKLTAILDDKFEYGDKKNRDYPLIIYASYTSTCVKLKNELNKYYETSNHKKDLYVDCFHGRMKKEEKKKVQDAFMNGKLNAIVATNAFGMGVDKTDVRNVIHFDISKSFEDYIQEAGRAGRDGDESCCRIIYANGDFEQNKYLLDGNIIYEEEIEAVWHSLCEKFLKKSVKAKQDNSEYLSISVSASSIAYETDVYKDKITRIIQHLESEGFLFRGENKISVYPSSIVQSFDSYEKKKLIEEIKICINERVNEEHDIDILIQSLDELKTKGGMFTYSDLKNDFQKKVGNVTFQWLFEAVKQLNRKGLLVSDNDIEITLVNPEKIYNLLEFEGRIFDCLKEHHSCKSRFINMVIGDLKNCGEFNNIGSSRQRKINELLQFWMEERYIPRNGGVFTNPVSDGYAVHNYEDPWKWMEESIDTRKDLCKKIINNLEKSEGTYCIGKKAYSEELGCTLKELDSALRFLTNMQIAEVKDRGALFSQGMILYRNNDDFKELEYTEDHYKRLKDHYLKGAAQKPILQIFMTLINEKSDKTSIYIHDYFWKDWNSFKSKYEKYLPEDSKEDFDVEYLIDNGISRDDEKLMLNDASGNRLDKTKQNIILDDHRIIRVDAGPGSGKTELLVSKCIWLIRKCHIRPEEILVLSFLNNTKDELAERVYRKIGDEARRIRFRTFHSFACELLGIPGDASFDNINDAAWMIENSLSDLDEKIYKTRALILDEAQDLSEAQYYLVNELLVVNKDNGIRLLIVGDSDQGIVGFDDEHEVDYSHYKDKIYENNEISQKKERKLYKLTTNYRSAKRIIDISNEYRHYIPDRENYSIMKSANNALEGSAGLYCGENAEDVLVEKVIESLKSDSSKSGHFGILCRTNSQAQLVFDKLHNLQDEKCPEIRNVNIKLKRGKEKGGAEPCSFSINRVEEMHALLARMHALSDKDDMLDEKTLHKCFKGYNYFTSKDELIKISNFIAYNILKPYSQDLEISLWQSLGRILRDCFDLFSVRNVVEIEDGIYEIPFTESNIYFEKCLDEIINGDKICSFVTCPEYLYILKERIYKQKDPGKIIHNILWICYECTKRERNHSLEAKLDKYGQVASVCFSKADWEWFFKNKFFCKTYRDKANFFTDNFRYKTEFAFLCTYYRLYDLYYMVDTLFWRQQNVATTRNLIREIFNGKSETSHSDSIDLYRVVAYELAYEKLTKINDESNTEKNNTLKSGYRNGLNYVYGKTNNSKEIINRIHSFAFEYFDTCSVWNDGKKCININDFETKCKEIKYCDFIDDSLEKGITITVSTIHKSKGREYDRVYLLPDKKKYDKNDENEKLLYVGMTRAKRNLEIFISSKSIYKEHLCNIFHKSEIIALSDSIPKNDTGICRLKLDLSDINLGYDIKENYLEKMNREWGTPGRFCNQRFECYYEEAFLYDAGTYFNADEYYSDIVHPDNETWKLGQYTVNNKGEDEVKYALNLYTNETGGAFLEMEFFSKSGNAKIREKFDQGYEIENVSISIYAVVLYDFMPRKKHIETDPSDHKSRICPGGRLDNLKLSDKGAVLGYDDIEVDNDDTLGKRRKKKTTVVKVVRKVYLPEITFKKSKQ